MTRRPFCRLFLNSNAKIFSLFDLDVNWARQFLSERVYVAFVRSVVIMAAVASLACDHS